MKKIRFVPYGYTIRDGHTVIEHSEADIIRHIFEVYIKGASLKEIAEDLTRRKIPYTEKTDVWDKSRIARIIDNSRYTGADSYDPIIDENTYEEATAVKNARRRNIVMQESDGIKLLRNRVRCAKCGAPMTRRICSKRQTKESWTCSNDVCGCRLRISDTELLLKVNLIMNRIIENSQLVIPKRRAKTQDSPVVAGLQAEIQKELIADRPSEELIISKLGEIASQLYRETNEKERIAAQILRKRILLMSPQENFNCDYFSDMIDIVYLACATGEVQLQTKTSTIIEGVNGDGGKENPEENRHAD